MASVDASPATDSWMMRGRSSGCSTLRQSNAIACSIREAREIRHKLSCERARAIELGTQIGNGGAVVH